jgi:protease-4
MGDMAASGGYYVAAGGERIYAQPGTLTGSIGIFSGKFDVSALMRRLGISSEAISAGKRALMDNFDRPYTAEERSFVLEQLQYYYRAFLAAVSAGRHMTQDQVHAVGRGRVWTGGQARAQRLVDAEGGLVDALEEARRLAGIDADRPLREVVLPEEQKGLIGRALDLLGGHATAGQELLPRALVGAARGILPVLLRARAGEPLARVPYHIELP